MTKIIHVEPTSRCNAACPMCARNVNGKGCIVPLMDLSFEPFKSLVNSCVDKLEKVFFCGSVGDPCADKNLLEKITWLKQTNKNITVGINTNGSIRNPRWWTNCGNLLSGPYDYVVFSIDGLEDTNHIYRVDVQLADSMGFTWFRSKETDRWDQFTLEQIKPANNPNVVDYHSINNVQCERNVEQSTYIDHRGQEFPCCHISEMYYSTTQTNNNKDILSHTPDELMTEYQTRLDNKNPFYTCRRSCGTTVSKRSQWKQEIQLR